MAVPAPSTCPRSPSFNNRQEEHSMAVENPKDWKTYDEFAYGIATNRLPASDALSGASHTVTFEDGRVLKLAFGTGTVNWSDGGAASEDECEVIEVAPNTYFIEIIFASRPSEAETL